MPRLAVVVFLVGIATGVVQPARAQVLDPDRSWRCSDTRQHAAAGVALDLVVRSAILAPAWRRSPVRRVALVVVVGAAYEGVETIAAWQDGSLGTPGRGFGIKDLAATAAGASMPISRR